MASPGHEVVRNRHTERPRGHLAYAPPPPRVPNGIDDRRTARGITGTRPPFDLLARGFPRCRLRMSRLHRLGLPGAVPLSSALGRIRRSCLALPRDRRNADSHNPRQRAAHHWRSMTILGRGAWVSPEERRAARDSPDPSSLASLSPWRGGG